MTFKFFDYMYEINQSTLSNTNPTCFKLITSTYLKINNFHVETRKCVKRVIL